MKNLVLAIALAGGMASVASADPLAATSSLDLKPYVGAERLMEGEKNKLYAGTSLSLGSLGVKLQANMLDTETTDWEFNRLDVDFSVKVADSATVYLNNDFDSDWDRTESTIGVKWTF